jgi:hypothetical protein
MSRHNDSPRPPWCYANNLVGRLREPSGVRLQMTHAGVCRLVVAVHLRYTPGLRSTVHCHNPVTCIAVPLCLNADVGSKSLIEWAGRVECCLQSLGSMCLS